MKRSLSSLYIVASLLFGSMLQADSSLQDSSKSSRPEEATWLEAAFCFVVASTVAYCTYELYKNTKLK